MHIKKTHTHTHTHTAALLPSGPVKRDITRGDTSREDWYHTDRSSWTNTDTHTQTHIHKQSRTECDQPGLLGMTELQTGRKGIR